VQCRSLWAFVSSDRNLLRKPPLAILPSVGKSEIRTVWVGELGTHVFVVKDIIDAISKNETLKDSIKVVRNRDSELNLKCDEIVYKVNVITDGGVQPINCATKFGIIRIILTVRELRKSKMIRWLEQFD